MISLTATLDPASWTGSDNAWAISCPDASNSALDASPTSRMACECAVSSSVVCISCAMPFNAFFTSSTVTTSRARVASA